MAAAAACETTAPALSGADPGTAPEVQPSEPAAAEIAAPETLTPEIETGEEVATPSQPIPVGQNASGLSVSQGRAVWAQDGDIWLYDPSLGPTLGAPRAIVRHPAIQKDPVLAGDRVIWADQRNGDFDLLSADLASPELVEPLVVRPDDDDAPSAHGDWLVWVGREVPNNLLTAEIWALSLAGTEPPVRLTEDGAEQGFPHVHEGRVVWSDFRNDPELSYLPPELSAMNNSDIYGWDLVTGEPFVVTAHPDKQLRPAIEGKLVVWMDWRGITPEPKYSQFHVYGTEIASGLEVHLATSGWTQPDLWKRPGIHAGFAAWIAERPPELGGTGVFLAPLSGGATKLVAGSEAILQAVEFREGQLAWLGGGELVITPFTP
jgi:hypothetical protein